MNILPENLHIAQRWLEGQPYNWGFPLINGLNKQGKYSPVTKENAIEIFNTKGVVFVKADITLPSINWDHLTDKYNFIAVDADRRGWAFEKYPLRTDMYWYPQDNSSCVELKHFTSFTAGNCPWENSVVERNKVENNEEKIDAYIDEINIQLGTYLTALPYKDPTVIDKLWGKVNRIHENLITLL